MFHSFGHNKLNVLALFYNFRNWCHWDHGVTESVKNRIINYPNSTYWLDLSSNYLPISIRALETNTFFFCNLDFFSFDFKIWWQFFIKVIQIFLWFPSWLVFRNRIGYMDVTIDRGQWPVGHCSQFMAKVYILLFTTSARQSPHNHHSCIMFSSLKEIFSWKNLF